MKTDLNSIKEELRRLTDTDYLKKEINRIADEVKRYDVKKNLSPKSAQKLEKLEARFRDVIEQLHELQRQVDTNLQKLMAKVRERTGRAPSGSAKSATKTTSKKVASVRKKRHKPGSVIEPAVAGPAETASSEASNKDVVKSSKKKASRKAATK